MTDANLLYVEDDPSQREIVKSILVQAGFNVDAFESAEEAMLALKKKPYDMVLSDWKLPQLSGLELLRFAKRQFPHTGFAMLTAYGTIANAVEAMDAGADDYLSKPFARQELLLCVDKVLKARTLATENERLREDLGHQSALVDMIGHAPCMQELFGRIERISKAPVTVLIQGESGTGKELAARALHQLSGRSGQFIAVNCGAIPEHLAESELFGAVKGAYTGADKDKQGKVQAANGGTLFLDEIAELPGTLQSKILRFLQEGKVNPVGSPEERDADVRVIAASHRNLEQMVADGDFREDLFYRLNVVPLLMPPLRDRKEDIGRLVSHFTAAAAGRYGVEAPAMSAATLKTLLDFSWPGNVRQLANLIERFVLIGDEEELLDSLKTRHQPSPSGGLSLPDEGVVWDDFEQDCLRQALARHQGNRSQAAKWLGMTYKAFLYRLEKYGVQSKDAK